MKTSLLATVLAAVSGASAGVLVRRPVPVPQPSSSSSSAAAPIAKPNPCRVGSNGLYSCFTMSTDNALSYCSTAASVYLTADTTVVLVAGPTSYVTVASGTVTSTSTDVSEVDVTSTTATVTSYSGVTSVRYTLPSTTQTTTVYVNENKRRRGVAATPAPTLYVLQRDGDGVGLEVYDEAHELDRRDADVPVTTVNVVKRQVSTIYVSTCTSSTMVTIKKRMTIRPVQPPSASSSASSSAPASASASASASRQGNPEPACLTELPAQQPAVLSSVCSDFVSAYGTKPATVTEEMMGPAVTLTVSSGVSVAWTVEQTTSTSTAFTVYHVTTVSTATISMCTVVTLTKTLTEV